MMIGTVMFLGGFFTALLAFYGRNAPLLMLAVVLFSFCWVGHEGVHKAFHAAPIVMLTTLGIALANQSNLFVWDQSCYIVSICFLMVLYLLVSLLPSKVKKMPPSWVASFFIGDQTEDLDR